MLNELMVVERGARRAGVEIAERHSDIKDVRRIPTLLVFLGVDGLPVAVRPMSPEAKPWSLRNGQQNSFPFVQPKSPLWKISADDERFDTALDKKSAERRSALLLLAKSEPFDAGAFQDWPGSGLVASLRERQQQLGILANTDAAGALLIFDRFLLACEVGGGTTCPLLMRTVAQMLVEGVRQNAQDDWFKVAAALLLGKGDKQNDDRECEGALLFDVLDSQLAIISPQLAIRVSEALRHAASTIADESVMGVCALTGTRSNLLVESFPQPNLPALGQTYLFAKNSEIPANDRYGRFSADAMPVGQDVAIRLSAALKALTSDDRRGVTWRKVPGELPKQTDLLLAFVEQAPDALVAATFGDDSTEDDLSEEYDDAPANHVGDSIAIFEKRAERLVAAVKGHVGADFSQTPVRLAVFRKVDLANRKVVYAGTPTVGELHNAVMAWGVGEKNVPAWLTLPVSRPGGSPPVHLAPPHVAPLGVIAFTRQLFIRAGTERQEVFGLPAAEALALFLEPANAAGGTAYNRARRILRCVLARRVTLVSGTALALRNGGASKGKFDHWEALRTATLLGVLLHKLGRTRETYMSEAAFKLGQLLAAADVVHCGYCADVRGGKVPPSLLGNQVFSTAQAAPIKALAMLMRRWKPYDGWAKKADRERERIDKLVKDDQQRGWDVRRALRYAREMTPLAKDLHATLVSNTVNDSFRAELLLGYLAGLPKAQKLESAGPAENATTIEEES